MKKKNIAILGSTVSIVVVLILSMVTIFPSLAQSELAEVSAPIVPTPTYQLIWDYKINVYESSDEVHEIYLSNIDTGVFAFLLFYPDGVSIPNDYVNSQGYVYLHYHQDYFEDAMKILRTEFPVYLWWSTSGHGLYTAMEPVGAPKAPVKLCFDFGTETSPLEEGFTRVTESTKYSSVRGYGWDATIGSSRDRGAPDDDLQRDFVQSSNGRWFGVNVPNGRYTVSLLFQDNNYMHDYIDVIIESNLRIDNLNLAAGNVYYPKFEVSVLDEWINIHFSDDGGSDANWIINAIRIESAT